MSPVRLQCGDATLGDDDQERGGHTSLAQQTGEAANCRKVCTSVHQENVDVVNVQKSSGLSRSDPHLVCQQTQRRQNFGGRFHRLGEQQQAHF